ncbi:MAG: class I SAM-dependent methyltransferase [Kordiimonadaceae bacterium]|mgnify:CR=1 FL=1|jgi:SAM-dependent methyltransferase|nr:class I SAM-dependent methyltransferase [Kordiimonadaceae bacterium]
MLKWDKEILTKYLKTNVVKSSHILDVGCGRGENLDLLKYLGYSNYIGTDISDDMLNICREKKHQVLKPNELQYRFDVILMSHVIEHIESQDVINFLEFYLNKLNSDGVLIILTPTFYDGFYNDIDHTRPYLPHGILNIFTSNRISRSYKSNYQIELKELKFRRTPLFRYFMSKRFTHGSDYVSVKIMDYLAILMFRLSFKFIGRVTGYFAVFKKA